jgi:hypothetical protein
MSTQFLLDTDDIKELANLMVLMIETQESRKQICRNFGINPHEVSFIIGTTDTEFCTELIDRLNRYGYQENICKLCCQGLFPILNKSAYSHRISILEKIAVKLNCNHDFGQNSPKNQTVEQPTSPIHGSVENQQAHSNQRNRAKPESWFTKISNVNKKLLAGGAILLIMLVGYPTFKQSPQLVEYKALIQKARPVLSESQGDIGQHTRDGGTLVKPTKNLNLRNFIVESQFDNPYDGAFMENWSYGFSFIENTGNNLNDPNRKRFSIWVSSNKEWHFTSHRSDLTGKLSNLNLSDKGSNRLSLTVKDKKVTFFVNDMYIETFDVSELTNQGDVFFVAKDGITGKPVLYKYENIRIWSLDN